VKYNVFSVMMTLSILLLSSPVLAGKVLLCPDLSQAKQVGECTTEDEIQSMFKRTYGVVCPGEANDPVECERYADFKQKKFSSLWESSDGEFMGYVPCGSSAAEISRGKPSSVMLSQKNGLYKITCNYQKGVSLSMRTRDVCRVLNEDDSLGVAYANCSGDANNCKIECD